MKVRVEISNDGEDEEIVIRCRNADDRVRRLEKLLTDELAPPSLLRFFKGDGAEKAEFFFSTDEVLFFETDGDAVFAHTTSDAFKTEMRLYELEAVLPSHFVRVSKSSLVNIRRIYSIRRNLTGASPVQFYASHKIVYVSRLYYKDLRRFLGRGE